LKRGGGISSKGEGQDEDEKIPDPAEKESEVFLENVLPIPLVGEVKKAST
jgi:hypothetical protein